MSEAIQHSLVREMRPCSGPPEQPRVGGFPVTNWKEWCQSICHEHNRRAIGHHWRVVEDQCGASCGIVRINQPRWDTRPTTERAWLHGDELQVRHSATVKTYKLTLARHNATVKTHITYVRMEGTSDVD